MAKQKTGNREAKGEIGLAEPCPCGSKKRYQQCCKRARFQWHREKNGEISKSIKIGPELKDVLDRNLADFEETFGRPARKNDRVLFQTYSMSERDLTRQSLEAMKAAGIRPILAYLYRRTGWIISDLKMLTPDERQEYNGVCDEFEAAVKSGADPDQLGYPDAIEHTLLDHLTKNHMVGGYFIENHFNQYRRVSEEMDDVETVAAISTINFVRCIKSVHALLSEELSYDAYNLLRSMYENYLTSKYTYAFPGEASAFIAQIGIQVGTHEYALNRAGDPIPAKIKELSTGNITSIPSRWQMSEKLDPIDREIYSELYRSFSSFSHSDLGNVTYFLKEGKFDYHNQDFTVDALIKCHLLCLLMFASLKQNSSCRTYLRRDLDFLCQRVFTVLLIAVQFLEEIESQRLPEIGWSIIQSVASHDAKLRSVLEAFQSEALP